VDGSDPSGSGIAFDGVIEIARELSERVGFRAGWKEEIEHDVPGCVTEGRRRHGAEGLETLGDSADVPRYLRGLKTARRGFPSVSVRGRCGGRGEIRMGGVIVGSCPA